MHSQRRVSLHGFEGNSCLLLSACVRGSPMVPLVGNICTIGASLITNGTIGKEIGANGKNGNAIGTNGTNVTNQWYHWENPEHTLCLCCS